MFESKHSVAPPQKKQFHNSVFLPFPAPHTNDPSLPKHVRKLVSQTAQKVVARHHVLFGRQVVPVYRQAKRSCPKRIRRCGAQGQFFGFCVQRFYRELRPGRGSQVPGSRGAAQGQAIRGRCLRRVLPCVVVLARLVRVPETQFIRFRSGRRLLVNHGIQLAWERGGRATITPRVSGKKYFSGTRPAARLVLRLVLKVIPRGGVFAPGTAVVASRVGGRFLQGRPDSGSGPRGLGGKNTRQTKVAAKEAAAHPRQGGCTPRQRGCCRCCNPWAGATKPYDETKANGVAIVCPGSWLVSSTEWPSRCDTSPRACTSRLPVRTARAI